MLVLTGPLMTDSSTNRGSAKHINQYCNVYSSCLLMRILLYIAMATSCSVVLFLSVKSLLQIAVHGYIMNI